jgi:hypothetical protein
VINFVEGAVKGAKVTTEGSVAVAVERCAYFSGNGFNGNLFAIKVSISIFEVMHFWSFKYFTG